MANGTIITLILILLGWGIIGGVVTTDWGYTCNLGSPGAFCLLWQQNALGMFDRVYKEVSADFGYREKGVVENFFDGLGNKIRSLKE